MIIMIHVVLTVFEFRCPCAEMSLVCVWTIVRAPELGLVVDRSRNPYTVRGALECDEQPGAEGRVQRLAKVFPLDGRPVDVEGLPDVLEVLHLLEVDQQALRCLKHFLVDLQYKNPLNINSSVVTHGLDWRR